MGMKLDREGLAGDDDYEQGNGLPLGAGPKRRIICNELLHFFGHVVLCFDLVM